MDRNHNTPRFHQEQISVRLVRACGSKLCKSGHLQTIHEVRLVRACGSKQGRAYRFRPDSLGQARKSLWIETELPGLCSESHAGQARKSLWIETSFPSNCIIPIQGQARKSLWIETRISSRLFFKELGQARKSLWIETVHCPE